MLPSLDELSLLHSHICQALGDPKRLLILYILAEQPANVTALTEVTGMPQPTVSRHLNTLRKANLVQCERQGQAVVYSLTDPRIIDVVDLMRTILRDSLQRHATTMA
jgi:ArsR family transcriptional regulator